MSARASISTALVLLGSQLSAQTPRDLVGAWEPVSIVNTSPDGTKTNQWGTPPKGSLLFTQDGRFNIILHRADLPKIVANSRAEGTPDENRAIVQGSIGFYGTYSMDGGTLIMKTEGGTYQNWAGTDQRSEISGFTSDQMTWTINSSRGGTNVANLRRVK